MRGFELRKGAYARLPQERLAENMVGVRSKVLGLCLCAKPSAPESIQSSLCWYDPVKDEFLSTRHDLADDIEQAKATIDTEKTRADAEKNRADAAERELARLRLLLEES